jgi:hypothetical protein
MTTSWRSGLGFCAIIHHHCPELLDFNSLDPDDVFGNNELAFQVCIIGFSRTVSGAIRIRSERRISLDPDP